MFALVDCNNFFVSCERVFRPELKRIPVAVLSNNDGCIISRSQEVKDLGIHMGMPYYQCKKEMAKHGVQVFSSNFALYGDLSHRVMTTLQTLNPTMETYSIDEAFLQLTGTHIIEECQTIKKTVEQWTKIPVSIGIGPTKVLAKVANHIAKTQKQYGGVCLFNKDNVTEYLTDLPVGEVWGIGRQTSNKLIRMNMRTVGQLMTMSNNWIKKELSINGLKIMQELRGIPCFSFEELPTPKKGIMCTRSFGKPVTAFKDLTEAVATYTERAAEKLRAGKQVTAYISVFIRTNLHNNDPKFSISKGMYLPTPTASSLLLTKATLQLLQSIYKEGPRYAKAGVCCTDLRPETAVQQNLLEPIDTDKHDRLMQSVDRINHHFGRDTVFLAGTGVQKSWQMKKNFRSPRYTTRIEELPIALAKK